MEQELTESGFVSLKTAEDVTAHMHDHKGTALLFVNSMCGCAGTGARAGLKMALAASALQPNSLITVFADVDEQATAQIFEYTKPYPPSSPTIALFKNGEPVYFMARHQIKGTLPELIAADLQEALQIHCQPAAAAV